MSPSEFQLRAALQDGEGDAPDADRLIAHAVGVRVQRRRRINAAVGGAAAVAVLAVGISALVGNRDGGGSAGGDSAGGANSVAARTAAGAAAAPSGGVARPSGSASTAASSRATPDGCPVAPDRFALPGGGGLGQFGSSDPLLPDGVTSLRLCGYPLRGTVERTTAIVTGAAATSIVTALNAAPSRPSSGKSCPANTDYMGGTIELIASVGGAVSTPVVVTLGCVNSLATNGTAARYLNDLPSAFVQLLTPSIVKSTAGGVPGRITVSPVR